MKNAINMQQQQIIFQILNWYDICKLFQLHDVSVNWRYVRNYVTVHWIFIALPVGMSKIIEPVILKSCHLYDELTEVYPFSKWPIQFYHTDNDKIVGGYIFIRWTYCTLIHITIYALFINAICDSWYIKPLATSDNWPYIFRGGA